MIYAAVARATWRAGNSYGHYHVPFLVDAANGDEAIGKANRILARIYPTAKGWTETHAWVSDAILTPETAKPETLPESRS